MWRLIINGGCQCCNTRRCCKYSCTRPISVQNWKLLDEHSSQQSISWELLLLRPIARNRLTWQSPGTIPAKPTMLHLHSHILSSATPHSDLPVLRRFLRCLSRRFLRCLSRYAYR